MSLFSSFIRKGYIKTFCALLFRKRPFKVQRSAFKVKKCLTQRMLFHASLGAPKLVKAKAHEWLFRKKVSGINRPNSPRAPEASD